MDPNHDQDDEELNDEAQSPRRSLTSGWPRILLVFGVLAVAAVIALMSFRDDGGRATPRGAEIVRGDAPTPEAAGKAPFLKEPDATGAAKSESSPSAGPPSALSGGSSPAALPQVAASTAASTTMADATRPGPSTVEKGAGPIKGTAGSAKDLTAKDATAKEASPSTKRDAGAAKEESEPVKPPTSKAATTKRPAVVKEPQSASKLAPADARAGAGGPYWVQVGAFKDAETANKVAARLREHKLRVELSEKRTGGAATPAPAPAPAEPLKNGADRYEVVVSGPSPADVNAKLVAKGLAAQPTADGAVITPSLPLGEAITLSKDLSADNLKVRVRRVGALQPASTPRPAPPSEGAETLHRVRVGSFTDRASAVAALRDLETKGFRPFLVRE